MMDFFREGGFSMFFVLILGVAALASGGLLSARPRLELVGVLRALSAATVFSVLGGVASDIAAVGAHVSENPDWAHSPDIHLIVLKGLSESMAPAILGFMLLTAAWLAAAVGVRKLGRSEPA